jgi:hypothetical protein
MDDFWTLTNNDDVMEFLEDDLWMTDEGYYVVKDDKDAIATIINQVWKNDIEAYIADSWGDIKDNILQQLVDKGYLTFDE